MNQADSADAFALDASWRATLQLNRWGLLIRALCLIVMASCLGALGEGPRLLLLTPSTVGLFLAFSEAKDDVLDHFPDVPFLGSLRAQLQLKRENHVPGPSISGVLETVGLLFAALSVVGPWAVPDTGSARAICVLAWLVLCWDVLSQILLDVSWHNRESPPTWWMRSFRAALPLAGFAATYWLLTRPAVADITLETAILLSSAFLFLWPWVALLSTFIGCGEQSASWIAGEVAHDTADRGAAAMHQVKVRLKHDPVLLDDASPETERERRVLEQVLTIVTLDWARAVIDSENMTPRQVWDHCSKVLPWLSNPQNGEDRRLIFEDQGIVGWLLEPSSTDLLRCIVLDLTANALEHSAGRVTVSVSRHDYSRLRDTVMVEVSDAGLGYCPSEYVQGSSLGTLSALLRRNQGELIHTINGHGGTTATASFPTALVPGEAPAATNHSPQSPRHAEDATERQGTT